MNIYDIAKLSGVSIATVSRVVNGSPRVSEKTKQKVLAVMEESEYTPNVFARGLGLNSMKTIGILCPDISDQYMAEAVSHLEKRLHECGYDCILGCSGSIKIEKKISYPVIVKPVNLGSSVGIKVAKDREELREALEYAFTFGPKVLVERAIMNLREINCAVLGDYEEAQASECEEPISSDEILSYEDKYVAGGKGGSEGMRTAKRELPAKLTPEKREEIRELAVKTFRTLGCNGVSRIDFMIDKDTNQVYVNEINPIPGSLAFYLWEALGKPYAALLDDMVKLALKREREEQSMLTSFDTNILQNANLSGAKGVKK